MYGGKRKPGYDTLERRGREINVKTTLQRNGSKLVGDYVKHGDSRTLGRVTKLLTHYESGLKGEAVACSTINWKVNRMQLLRVGNFFPSESRSGET